MKSPNTKSHASAPAFARAGTHVYLGDVLCEKGDWDGAIQEYREALRLGLGHDEVHVCLGLALRQKGDLDGAIQEFREGLRLSPAIADFHYGLGLALWQKGVRVGAIAEFRAYLRFADDDARKQRVQDFLRELGEKP